MKKKSKVERATPRSKKSAARALAVGAGSAPLACKVRDNKLVIEIGVETLAWASHWKNGGPLNTCKVDKRRRKAWAKDVGRAMTREDEVGNSPLNDFLDKMMIAAADDGSEALLFPQIAEISHDRERKI
jgi:hypothetical protein